MTQWGSSAKKKFASPPKKEKKRPNKKESKKSEEDSSVNQAPSIHPPFLSLTQQPLALSFFWNATKNQLPM